MKTIINYLIELNLGLILFYLAYWLLLRNENQFSKKRIFLLTAIICSVVFPFISLPSDTAAIPTLSQAIPTHWLPEVVLSANGTTELVHTDTASNYWHWLVIVYSTVSISLLAAILFRIIKMIVLYYQAHKYTWKTYTIAETDKISGVFSFFRYIFINTANDLDKTEREDILLHEEVHISKLHSVDILLINLIETICWFNPVIRYYKKSLVQLHEFEADARSVENMDADQYCGLLAKAALQQNGYALANHFTSSFTIKRINMIRTIKTKISSWKVASAFLVLVAYFITVACQEQLMEDFKEVSRNSGMSIEYPQYVKDKITELSKIYPDAEYVIVEMNEQGQEKLKKIPGDQINSVHMVKSKDGSGQAYVILQKGEQLNQLAQASKLDGNVFTVVEHMPRFKGGMEELYKFLLKEIKYPAVAREKGIEGSVFIQFVVDEVGAVSDVRVLKGIDPECDNEAKRVISSSPAWEPGTQSGKAVKTRMVLPIVFKKAGSQTSLGQNNNPNALNEIVVVGYEKKN